MFPRNPFSQKIRSFLTRSPFLSPSYTVPLALSCTHMRYRGLPHAWLKKSALRQKKRLALIVTEKSVLRANLDGRGNENWLVGWRKLLRETRKSESETATHEKTKNFFSPKRNSLFSFIAIKYDLNLRTYNTIVSFIEFSIDIFSVQKFNQFQSL